MIWARLFAFLIFLMGLALLYVVPVSRVSCDKKTGDVSCRVDMAFVGILPYNPVQIDHVLGTDISSNPATIEPGKSGPNDARPNDTYQLAFVTPQGRIAPRGLDASDPQTFREIASSIDALERGEGEPFTTSTWNTFPIVAGLLFAFVGGAAAFLGS